MIIVEPTNRVKGLDLIKRLKTMDESLLLCTGGGDKNHPQEKEMQKGKWLSEEALQIAEKRREDNGKGEKER